MPKGIACQKEFCWTADSQAFHCAALLYPLCSPSRQAHEPYSHEPRHHNRSCDYINICRTLARREHWYTQLGQPAPPQHHPKHVICNLLNSWELWLEVQAGVERS